MRRLRRSFFARPVLQVAPDLLGCTIEHAGVTIRVTETEAYAGHLGDPGSHAFRGETPRTRPMFGPPGLTYVYFTYGNHWMLCLTTGRVGEAEAVLVRAGEVVDGMPLARERRPSGPERDLARGPGRLARVLDLDGSHTGRDVCRPALTHPAAPGPGDRILGPPLDLVVREPEQPVPAECIRTGPRVGVSGPGGDGTTYPWRFWIDGDPTVSTYRPGLRRRTP